MTNDELKEYIYHYATEDKTHSAIMLTGGWGTGKSYFIQNALKPYLKEKGIECVIVSLYGLKELTEISKLIYLDAKFGKLSEKTRFIKSKFKHSEEGVFAVKTIFKGLFSYKGIDISLSDSSIEKLVKSIDLTNKLVVVEDLERSDINIAEVLGFVNSLVEQDNIKVLLIANEEEIAKKVEVEVKKDKKKDPFYVPKYKYTEDAFEYLRIKEKTISDTVVFNNDNRQSIINIVKKFKNKNLERFLNEESVCEIESFASVDGQINFRSFIYACQKTIDIFEKINCESFDDDFIKSMFFGIVSFSAKIKTATEDVKWDGNAYISVDLGSRKYPLYKFCFDYILYQKLDVSKIIEFSNAYNEYKLYDYDSMRFNAITNVINNWKIKSDIEVEEALTSLLDKLQNGDTEIPVFQYAEIYLQILYLAKIFDINSQLYKDAMIKNLSGTEDKVDLFYMFMGFSIKDTDINLQFSEFAKEVQDAVKQGESSLGNVSYDNVSEMLEVITKERDEYLTNKEFATLINIEKFIELIFKCNASQIIQIRQSFNEIYKPSNISLFLSNDKDALKELKDCLEERLKSYNGEKITKHSIELFVKEISEYIDKLQ